MLLKLHLFNTILTEIFNSIHLLTRQTLEGGKHFELKRKKKKKRKEKAISRVTYTLLVLFKITSFPFSLLYFLSFLVLSRYITSLILGILIPPKGCIPVAQAVVRHNSQLHHGSFTVLRQRKAAL